MNIFNQANNKDGDEGDPLTQDKKQKKSGKSDLKKFDIQNDENLIAELKREIKEIEDEIDGIKQYSNSDERREEEQYQYESSQLISDELWCKIVGFLGAFLIYALLLVVRLLIGIGLKGGLPTFEEVYTILE